MSQINGDVPTAVISEQDQWGWMTRKLLLWSGREDVVGKGAQRWTPEMILRGQRGIHEGRRRQAEQSTH